MYAGAKLQRAGGLVAKGGVGYHGANSLLRVRAAHSHRTWSHPSLKARPSLIVTDHAPYANPQLIQPFYLPQIPKYMHYQVKEDHIDPTNTVEPDSMLAYTQHPDFETYQAASMDAGILFPSLLMGLPRINRFVTQSPKVVVSMIASLAMFAFVEAQFQISQNLLAAAHTLYNYIPILMIGLVTLALGRVNYDVSKRLGQWASGLLEKLQPDKEHSSFIWSLPFAVTGYTALGLFSAAAIDSFQLIPKSVFLGALGALAIGLHTLLKTNVNGVVDNLLLSRYDRNLSQLNPGDELMLKRGRGVVQQVETGKGVYLEIQSADGTESEAFVPYTDLVKEEPSMIRKSPVVRDMSAEKTSEVVTHFLEQVQSGRVQKGEKVIFYRLDDNGNHVVHVQGEFARVSNGIVELIRGDDSVVNFPLSEISRVAVYWSRKTDSRTQVRREEDQDSSKKPSLLDKIWARADKGK